MGAGSECRATGRVSASTLRPPGPIAQLVEQGTFNPKVVGSIPTRPIKKLLVNDIIVRRLLDTVLSGSTNGVRKDGVRMASLQAKHRAACAIGKSWTTFEAATATCTCPQGPTYYVVVREGSSNRKTRVGHNRKVAERALKRPGFRRGSFIWQTRFRCCLSCNSIPHTRSAASHRALRAAARRCRS